MILAALALSSALVRVPAPSAADLDAARFGSRTFGPSRKAAIPFRPDIETYTMGTYSTLPTQAVRAGNAWFLAYYHGEFGGALWRFNADGSVGTQLLTAPTYDLVRYGDEVLAATGSAAPFFFKPLRVHRFAYRGGAWREIAHVDFPYNLIDLTVAGNQLYAMAGMHPERQTFVRVALSGTVQPLWETSANLYISNISVAPGGDITIDARGYVVRLHRRGSAFTAQWYAPRDCVRYTQAADPFDAHCIAAPGSKPYLHATSEPARAVAAVSADGTWLFAQRGPHLLHYSGGVWREAAVPADMLGFFEIHDHGVAWSAQRRDDGWYASATYANGRRLTADLHIDVPSGQEPMLAADPSGGAWFTIPNASFLGHVDARGAVSRIPLSAPAAMVHAGKTAVWFTETDNRHYGFADGRGDVHERSWSLENSSIRGILPAQNGAWLQETFAGERSFYRHINADGSSDYTLYLPDASSGIVAPDGTLYARSTKWPTILRLTEDGALSSYRLPCAGGFIRLMAAPENGVWFASDDPGCTGIIENGAIHARDFPLVRTVYYM